MPNEIRIEFDYEDKDKNFEAINFISCKLNELGYSFAIFITEGGRGPHLHLYDLDELENMTYEERTIFRTKFLNKICGKYKPDLALCDEKHLCALEFVNHFKYNTPKQLWGYVWNGKNQGVDTDIILDIMLKEKKKIYKSNTQKSLKFGDRLRLKQRDIILNECNFEKVLDKYNVKYKGHMAQCPFHNDTNYSLSFSNQKGLWKCFGSGCESQGDIITLIKKLMELK